GPDSMALLHCLSILRERLDFRLLAISIDHGLRPEAPEEVDLVRRFAEELGVPFRSARLSLPSGSNIQARPREARYEALHCIAVEELGQLSFIASAHHAEDRVETVHLRLFRGTSVEGLEVLPPVAGRLLPPMITAQKSEVLCHNDRHRVP